MFFGCFSPNTYGMGSFLDVVWVVSSVTKIISGVSYLVVVEEVVSFIALI